MKSLLFIIALILELFYIWMFVLTIRRPGFRFWPPPVWLKNSIWASFLPQISFRTLRVQMISMLTENATRDQDYRTRTNCAVRSKT